jgi:type VI secretion system secreted protein Hcp
MAENVYLFLKASGNDIPGDSTVSSDGRENSIECLEYRDAVMVPTEASSGLAAGRRSYEPIKILKRLDRSTPLIFKALCNNETIEATFRFFRPNPTGDGTSQHFFTVEIQQASISQIERVNPNTIQGVTATEPAYEEVSFVFGSIRTCYEDGGIEHVDVWRQET